jgi:hypothetical protein
MEVSRQCPLVLLVEVEEKVRRSEVEKVER